MPLYDYDCAACGRRFEVVHGLHAPAPEACPLCGGGPIRKAVTAPAVHFKGSGWAKKERRSAASGSGSGSKDGETKDGETKDGETKDGEPKAGDGKAGTIDGPKPAEPATTGASADRGGTASSSTTATSGGSAGD
jgi:putative FmdB family regulatory protein